MGRRPCGKQCSQLAFGMSRRNNIVEPLCNTTLHSRGADPMLTIAGQGEDRFCDGIARRDFLKLGGLALGGLSMPQLLRAEATSGVRRSQKAVIMVFLAGGPPHQDMFDMKPKAPEGIRGEYRPIATDL